MQHSTRLSLLILSLLLASGLILTLFTVKFQVQDLEDELVRLNKMVVADLQAIHVLEAEWSHLNEPARLRNLAERHLGLVEIRPDQLVKIESLKTHLVRNASGEGTRNSKTPNIEIKAVKGGR
ncbi:MAG: hypothetical protein OEY85_03135 [Rhodospirillales bacterium]|nr:hypothetical protein [Rhodospirillales bacterium]